MNKKGFVKFLAYALPLMLLLAVLYLIYMPFGYSDSRIINVGRESDTKGSFYLEESSSLGSRQMLEGNYFRGIDGVVYAVYKPNVILNNASVFISLEGENVSFVSMPPVNFIWDYDFDFNKMEVNAPHSVYERFLNGTEIENPDFSRPFGILIEWHASLSETLIQGDLILLQDSKYVILEFNGSKIRYDIPDFFIGKNQSALIGFNGKEIYFFINGEFIGKQKAEGFNDIEFSNANIKIFSDYDGEIKENYPLKDECVFFDGKTRFIYPNSSDIFEVGPFAVYFEWIPEKQENSQQIIGHYNWEILQDKDNVLFNAGRMYDQGPMYTVSFGIDPVFFNMKHSLLALYNPSENGYIELYVDGNFADRAYFGNQTIWADYGDQDLGFGWTSHNYGKNPYFQGSICNARFAYKKLEPEFSNSLEFVSSFEEIRFPIFGTGKLDKIDLKVKK